MEREIVLLTEDSVPARVLAHTIVMHNLNLRGIIIQNTIPGTLAKKALHKGSLFKVILRKVIPKTIYRKLWYLKQPVQVRELRKIRRRLSDQANEVLLTRLGQKANCTWPTQLDILTVSSVNSEESYNYLTRAKPDLLAVWGTSILKRRIIEIPELGALNAHSAILPDYKGNFVEFWQAYNCDYDKAGITIHFIDPGVDTGDIVFQKKLNIGATSNPYLISALNKIEVINSYPTVIKSVLDGTAVRSKQGDSSLPVYRLSDITTEKELELYTRQGCD